MRWYRADMHIHSVLSPCGDLDMSPVRIIHEAKIKGLDIIAITDHNASDHARLMIELGKQTGITVFPGLEVNTQEEVHCLALFENIEKTEMFQEYIDKNLPDIMNCPEKFGHQVVVNESEEIVAEKKKLLLSGVMVGISEVEKKVHELDGIFIPAHVDRKRNSIFSQIGFIPEDLKIDAIEISSNVDFKEFLNTKPALRKYAAITNSDAHYPENIAKSSTLYYMQEPTFVEWKKSLGCLGNRKIKLA